VEDDIGRNAARAEKESLANFIYFSNEFFFPLFGYLTRTL
jgi:hypothetical protein